MNLCDAPHSFNNLHRPAAGLRPRRWFAGLQKFTKVTNLVQKEQI